jgi:AraC-like DNA-binding protein
MKTIVVLNNRKLFCDNQDYAYRTFAEPFGFIKPKFKKTDRLIEEIINQISEVLRIGNKSVMTYCKIPLEEKAKYDTVLLVKKSKAMENQELKATTIQLIQDMIADGYSHIKISETIGKSERTVRRYLKADPSGRHGRTGLKQKQKLDPYKDEVLALSAKGQSSPKILCSIRNSGYTGSASSLREFLHKYSIEAAAERNRSHLTLCRIERPSLIALLYKDISKVKEISDDHYLRIIGLFPELGAVLQLLKTFKSVLMAGKPNELDAWIEAAKSLDIPELNSFLTGVRRDLEAIKNVILFPYSNGLA